MQTVKKSSMLIPLLVVLVLVIGGTIALYGGTGGLQGNIGIRAPSAVTPATSSVTPGSKVRAPGITASFACTATPDRTNSRIYHISFTDKSLVYGGAKPVSTIKVRRPASTDPTLVYTPATIASSDLIYLSGDQTLVYEVLNSDGVIGKVYGSITQCDGYLVY